jgi:hypothetical protein
MAALAQHKMNQTSNNLLNHSNSDHLGKFLQEGALQYESVITQITALLLGGLEQNMEIKAKSFKLNSLSAVFSLNNFHYFSKFLK